MKKKSILPAGLGAGIFFTLLFFVFSGLSYAGPVLPGYRQDEILVKMRPETGLAERTVSANAILGMVKSLGGLQARKLNTNRVAPGLYSLKLKPGENVEDKVLELMSNPDVEYAQPNYVFHATQLPPNDPDFSQQWGLPNIGMPDAWAVTTGSQNVIVAVVDTGIDYTHTDLIPNLWTNPADGTHGFNAITETNYPMDDNGHGTHVSGIIGGAGNNAVVGVNWTTSIMALKFLDSSGSGYDSDAIECINYAVQMKQEGQNVRVINASWGGNPGDGDDPALEDAIQSASDNDILFVAAAGNDHNNNDLKSEYPASSPKPNVVSVAATDESGGLAYFSNYGTNTVDVAAPGVDILSTYPLSLNPAGYEYMSGTSMATPFVSGLAALILAENPNLSTTQVKDLIMVSSDNTRLPVRSGGRIDAAKALAYTLGDGAITCSVAQDGGFETLSATLTNNLPQYGKRVNFYRDGAYAGYALTGGATSKHPNVAVLKIRGISPGSHSAYAASSAYARVQMQSNAVSYTVSAPSITCVSPASGSNGAIIALDGSNFGSLKRYVYIKPAAGVVAAIRPLTWTDGEITFRLPPRLAGTYNLFINDGMISNQMPLIVPLPSISSVAPGTASAGTTVTVSGGNFGALKGVVSLKAPTVAASVKPVTWSDTSITFIAPPRPLGAYSISVLNRAGKSAPSTFNIPLPSISGLSQTSAKAGTVITITGTYFGRLKGAVLMVPAAGKATGVLPLAWTETSITFRVPLRRAGPYNLIVRNRAGNSAPTSFTISP